MAPLPENPLGSSGGSQVSIGAGVIPTSDTQPSMAASGLGSGPLPAILETDTTLKSQLVHVHVGYELFHTFFGGDF